MKNQTSNEQLAMSNRSARQRNSKLLLLIAHCALLITGGGEADAAKLCKKTCPLAAASVLASNRQNLAPASDSIWDANPDWVVSNAAYTIKGISFCGASNPNNGAAAAGNNCYCRILTINDEMQCGGNWVQKVSTPDPCSGNCPDECAWAMTTDAYLNNGFINSILQ
ncbi:MAG: hypothetical protein LBL46_03820 [Rickettsiales bacterium]|jgi:hypothetical protein|nr:hypothetical protein [Rickettsiales bacterium]